MKNKKIPGIIITLIQLAASIIFVMLLYRTKLIPNKYLLMIGAVLLLVTFVVFLLTKNSRHKVRLVIGILLTIVMIAVYGIGQGYVTKAVNTLNNITQTTVELADIGIYVRQDDAAAEIADTVGYTFGTQEFLDRENTDKAVAEISAAIGHISPKEYVGIIELVDSLMTGETDAIIMNSAFLDLITEIEGYERVTEQLREVHIEKVETVIDSVQESQTSQEKQEESVNQEDGEDDAQDVAVFTVYISGIDSRTGLVAKSRSDVNIIATVNTETRQVLLISTPRDYYVPLSISNGVPDKLTHAGIYGIDVSMGTLEMLYETEIDYYFRVNFSGFEEIIDALGGVTIVSDYTFDSQNVKGYFFVKGENYVDGATALAFARERYAFSEGDRQRGRNQLAVIEGVIKKAMSPALLTNFSEIMESIEGSFETSVPYNVIAEVVRKQLNEGGEWNVVSYSVDGTGASRRPYSMSTNAYVMVPDYNTVNTAISMMDQVKEGQMLEAR